MIKVPMSIDQTCHGSCCCFEARIGQLTDSRIQSAVDQQCTAVVHNGRNVSSVSSKYPYAVVQRNGFQRGALKLFSGFLDHGLRCHLPRNRDGCSSGQKYEDNHLNRGKCEPYFLKNSLHSVLLFPGISPHGWNDRSGYLCLRQLPLPCRRLNQTLRPPP